MSRGGLGGSWWCRKRQAKNRAAHEAARRARRQLFEAAEQGDAKAVKRLVEMEAVPYSGMEDGRTLLHACVTKPDQAQQAAERRQVGREGGRGQGKAGRGGRQLADPRGLSGAAVFWYVNHQAAAFILNIDALR